MPDDPARLWSKTPPTPPGPYWFRCVPESVPFIVTLIGDVPLQFVSALERTATLADWLVQYPGEWGPRCYLPIAAPVECICPNCHGHTQLDGADFCAMCVGTGRGVFIPLKIEEQTDA